MIRVTRDVATCHVLRRAVFVEEQEIDEADEWDDLDDEAIHFLAFHDGLPVGTARMLIRGDTAKIGRVCVLAARRGTGLGADMIRAAMDHARELPGVTRAYLSAQSRVLGFYERLGFVAYGEEYDDAGIPHRDMERAF